MRSFLRIPLEFSSSCRIERFFKGLLLKRLLIIGLFVCSIDKVRNIFPGCLEKIILYVSFLVKLATLDEGIVAEV